MVESNIKDYGDVKIEIYDTTLRDGAQSRDVTLTVRDRIEILKLLDAMKVDFVELGWPGSNPKDKETFFIANKTKLKNAKTAAFCMTARPNTDPKDDPNLRGAVESGAHVATVVGKVWVEHVEKQLKTSKEGNLRTIEDSIRFLKGKGMVVFFDAEHFYDGFKGDETYALEVLRIARKAGAKRLILCDTNGGCLPNEIFDITKKVYSALMVKGSRPLLGIHCHNDSGCATANSLICSEFLTQIQGTVNGFGERCGNADLCEVIPGLMLKQGKNLAIDLKSLKNLSSTLYTLTNTNKRTNQPYVGKNAFSHKGGLHVDAISKGASYEHIKPESVGSSREIILSDLSGSANIVEMLKSYNIKSDKSDIKVKSLLSAVKDLEKLGYNITDLKAEQVILVNKFFWHHEMINIKDWKVVCEDRGGEFSEAIIGISVGDKDFHEVARVKGGPVDVMYKAIQKVVSRKHPEIKNVKLINYKVMIAEDKGPESTVRVYIEFKNHDDEWATAGVSSNILKASIEAIKKGFDYYLIRKLNK